MITQSSLFSHRFHCRQVGIDTTMEAISLYVRCVAYVHREVIISEYGITISFCNDVLYGLRTIITAHHSKMVGM